MNLLPPLGGIENSTLALHRRKLAAVLVKEWGMPKTVDEVLTLANDPLLTDEARAMVMSRFVDVRMLAMGMAPICGTVERDRWESVPAPDPRSECIDAIRRAKIGAIARRADPAFIRGLGAAIKALEKR